MIPRKTARNVAAFLGAARKRAAPFLWSGVMAATIGTGSTITYGGGGGITEELLSISIDGIEAPVIDQTHMGSGTLRSFVAGSLIDPGSLTAEVHHLGTVDPESLVGTNGSLAILFGTGGSTWTWADAICQSYSANDPLEDKVTGTYTFKLNGALTVS